MWLRARPVDASRITPAHAFLYAERRHLGIGEHLVTTYPAVNAADANTRHARLCDRAGAHVDQHQPCFLKRISVHHQVEGGAPFAANRGLRMDIVIENGGLRDASASDFRHKSIPIDVTCADSQAEGPLRTRSADQDGSAASTSEARKRNYYARPGHVSFDKRTHKHATIAVESFERLIREERKFMDQPATSVVGGRDRGAMTKKGICKEHLLQKISVTFLRLRSYTDFTGISA